MAGKAPADQFYFGDFARDMSGHPLEIVGAWSLVLVQTWFSSTRGTVSKTAEQWARIFGVSAEDAARILDYIGHEKIGEVAKELSGNLTEPNTIITVTNRRQRRDEIRRENNRIRQYNHYHKAKSHSILTVHSSSSSSTAKKKSTRASENFTLPEWLSQELWDLYLENRTARKGKVPKGGYQILVDKLSRIRDMGYDIREVVNTMVEKGWVSFDPSWNHGLKPKHGGPLAPYQGKTVDEERREREQELAEDKRLHPELYEDSAKVIKQFGIMFKNDERR